MKLSQFKFKLPEAQVALEPDPFRDGCRMLVLHRKTGKVEHKMFNDLLNYFNEGDVFVFNDTKVIPAHLHGNKERTGARIDVLLRRELNAEDRLWDVTVDPARKIRIGNKLYFGPDDSLVAEVIDNTTSRGRTLRFLYDGPHEEFKRDLYALGVAPLPSYIKREAVEEDMENFQTIYARVEGATTAPATGLHFSRHDTISSVLWNEFSAEVPLEAVRETAIRLRPFLKEIFAKYPISDEFAYMPEYNSLYTEITGFVQLKLEEDGKL